ncbi:MAG: YbhB/YbcL family Raf kinase inhibitor-like protein [Chloroflexi bacterium]|nr:YbhB/YbcL family Raf kinase inhibitor-like protein [Chloroflexota bacterium]
MAPSKFEALDPNFGGFFIPHRKLKITKIRISLLPPILLLFAVTAVSISCSNGDDAEKQFDPERSLIATLDLSSPAFEDGGSIPSEYTCDGADDSPPIRWGDVPSGTKSIAIVVDAPDAPSRIFRHWSVYNIPAGTNSLSAGQETLFELKDSARNSINDFGNVGYSGPCPPDGETHEYVFFIYALSEQLLFESPPSPMEISSAIRGKVFGTGSFSGMYGRQ